MWYAKMYFSEDREIFQYDSLGTQGVPDVQKEFPFLESLLSFQELDCAEVTPILQSITDNWSRFIAEDDRDALENVRRKLGRLASIHIYFRLLFVHCRYRQSAMYIQNDRGSAEDAQILDELRQLPEQLPLYQQQIQRFFELVLDVDSAGREPQAQAAKNYFHDSPKDPDLFCFHPIPLSFEPVEPGRCSPVLYSSSIRDMIDYCREIGAFKQWTKKQSDDPIFKAYRKEYKRRFAWIKAGRITDEAFYAWSEKAREEKQKCDRDIISLAEFQQWLKESK